MTDNEIIKALECCGSNGWGEEDVRPCDNCPMQECEDCEVELPDYALNLINRQKAEIEKLKFENLALSQKRITMFERIELVNNARTKAIREFANRLKYGVSITSGRITCEDIDNLVKGMTEETNDKQKT